MNNPYASPMFDVRNMAPRQDQQPGGMFDVRNMLAPPQQPAQRPERAPAYNALAQHGGPTRAAAGAMGDFANAIATVESGGRYDALGPVVNNGGMYSGDRAYGKYQVMGRNIPEWTRTALGYEMTPQEFLASPQAQDAVFQHYFGKSLAKYGNPQDAASVWFSGQPLERARGRTDGYTEVGEYVGKFTAALSPEIRSAIFD